jgi:hypothetical protein
LGGRGGNRFEARHGLERGCVLALQERPECLPVAVGEGEEPALLGPGRVRP